MARTKSAEKSERKTMKRKEINQARKSTVKTSIKKFLEAVTTKKPIEEIDIFFKNAVSQLQRAARKGTLKLNNASRRVSRIALKLKKVKKEQEIIN